MDGESNFLFRFPKQKSELAAERKEYRWPQTGNWNTKTEIPHTQKWTAYLSARGSVYWRLQQCRRSAVDRITVSFERKQQSVLKKNSSEEQAVMPQGPPFRLHI